MQAQTDGTLNAAALTALDSSFKDLQRVGSLSDQNDFMWVRRCYAVPEKLNPNKDPFMYHVYGTIVQGLFSSYAQLESKILEKIINFRDQLGEPIKGTVYVMMTQVPYFKNDNGNPIYGGYSTLSAQNLTPTNLFCPNNGIQSCTRTQCPNGNTICNVYHFAHIIFANYDKDKNYYADSPFECSSLGSLESQAVSRQQCFIRMKDSEKIGGCATVDVSTGSSLYSQYNEKNYDYKCFGSGSDQLNTMTYYVLYEVNPDNVQSTALFNHRLQ
jgi:hypothetical protein